MNKLKKYSHIERSFFEIDDEKKTAHIVLHFEKASDMLDESFASKKPVLNEDFFYKLRNSFSMVPKKYKIELTVAVNDTEGYTKEALSDIFDDNIMLEYKALHSEQKSRTFLAIGLVILGMIFFVLMIMIGAKWEDESLLRDGFFFISDIASTVTLWEALCILLVENRGNRSYLHSLHSRFCSIEFVGEKG